MGAPLVSTVQNFQNLVVFGRTISAETQYSVF